mmetsp:Transcript_3047/g.12320  ORF Transcript_3047/g.12320 Transcript_3047/m.12320 type:complete len:146 (+) Transcript_3047:1217-1654(+)
MEQLLQNGLRLIRQYPPEILLCQSDWERTMRIYGAGWILDAVSGETRHPSLQAFVWPPTWYEGEDSLAPDWQLLGDHRRRLGRKGTSRATRHRRRLAREAGALLDFPFNEEGLGSSRMVALGVTLLIGGFAMYWNMRNQRGMSAH